MTATIKQLTANRANALVSTGPTSVGGKGKASRNATQHGILSARLLVDDEEADDYGALLRELVGALRPVGAAEAALVERIAITIWRQRRLVTAETATLSLSRQPSEIAADLNRRPSLSGSNDLDADDLQPFDTDHLDWSKGVVEEIGWLDADMPLDRLAQALPLTYKQLETDAAEAEMSIDAYLAGATGGLKGCADELADYCREEIEAAERRPRVLELAETMRRRRLILNPEMLEVFSRYQMTLDNQLVKLLKALRETQAWRLETLDALNEGVETTADAAE